jgi:DNA-binding XRE family transcriptional regulator
MSTFKDIRISLSLSQSELARKADVSDKTIHRIESGNANISDTVARKLAKAMRCTPDEIKLLASGGSIDWQIDDYEGAHDIVHKRTKELRIREALYAEYLYGKPLSQINKADVFTFTMKWIGHPFPEGHEEYRSTANFAI